MYYADSKTMDLKTLTSISQNKDMWTWITPILSLRFVSHQCVQVWRLASRKKNSEPHTNPPHCELRTALCSSEKPTGPVSIMRTIAIDSARKCIRTFRRACGKHCFSECLCSTSFLFFQFCDWLFIHLIDMAYGT